MRRNELKVASRDHNGVFIRTRPNPCDLRIVVEDNSVLGAWTGLR